MEPGHEDREYNLIKDFLRAIREPQWSPVMKTGNTPLPSGHPDLHVRLNGARS